MQFWCCFRVGHLHTFFKPNHGDFEWTTWPDCGAFAAFPKKEKKNRNAQKMSVGEGGGHPWLKALSKRQNWPGRPWCTRHFGNETGFFQEVLLKNHILSFVHNIYDENGLACEFWQMESALKHKRSIEFIRNNVKLFTYKCSGIEQHLQKRF